MKIFEKLFFRLNSREQTLLVISLWVVFGLLLMKLFEAGTGIWQDWNLAAEEIKGHQMVIGLKPMIDAALEKQKVEQQNKSYDKNQLSNLASRLADQVFPKETTGNSAQTSVRDISSIVSVSLLREPAMKMSMNMQHSSDRRAHTCF